MGLEDYGIEELKVPECVRITNRREHVAEVALLEVPRHISSGDVGRHAGCKMICQQYQDDCMQPSCPRRSGHSSPRDAKLGEWLVA